MFMLHQAARGGVHQAFWMKPGTIFCGRTSWWRYHDQSVVAQASTEKVMPHSGFYMRREIIKQESISTTFTRTQCAHFTVKSKLISTFYKVKISQFPVVELQNQSYQYYIEMHSRICNNIIIYIIIYNNIEYNIYIIYIIIYIIM